MILYNNNSNKLIQVKENPFKLERDIQNNIENKVSSEEDTISQFRLYIPNGFTPT